MTDVAEIARGLTKAQRYAFLRAWPVSGPSGDWLVLGSDVEAIWDHDDALDLLHPITGRLLPLGLQVRAHLSKDTDNG